MNIFDSIRTETRPHRDRTAIVEGDRLITYAQLLEHAQAHRDKFADLGIGPGQRIAFHCGGGIDCVVGALALLAAGAALVPVADSLTATEVRDTLERIDVHGLLTHRDLVCPAKQDSDDEPGDRRADGSCDIPGDGPGDGPCDVDGPGDRLGDGPGDLFVWQLRRASGESDQVCRDINAAFIRFSSGTTGVNKGVVLSHRTILDRTDAADRGLNMSHQDMVLWALDMSHHFVVSILLFLRKAATIVVASERFPFSFLEAAEKFPVTFIYASPVHYHLLASSGAVPATALAQVRMAISTAMKMPAGISEAFADKFGFAPAEAYGIIEIGLPFIHRDTSAAGAGTVGRILPDYQLRIDRPDATGMGEVHIRGKGMFDAYYSPWRLRDECLCDGWFPTGDLGRLDERARLHLMGRCKTVIVCAGMKIFPEEVEEVLSALPGVAESLVFGQQHPQFGQVPAALVVLFEPVGDRKQWLIDTRRHCCDKLSSYKVPVEIKLVASLPKTPSGKPRRHGL